MIRFLSIFFGCYGKSLFLRTVNRLSTVHTTYLWWWLGDGLVLFYTHCLYNLYKSILCVQRDVLGLRHQRIILRQDRRLIRQPNLQRGRCAATDHFEGGHGDAEPRSCDCLERNKSWPFLWGKAMAYPKSSPWMVTSRSHGMFIVGDIKRPQKTRCVSDCWDLAFCIKTWDSNSKCRVWMLQPLTCSREKKRWRLRKGFNNMSMHMEWYRSATNWCGTWISSLCLYNGDPRKQNFCIGNMMSIQFWDSL